MRCENDGKHALLDHFFWMNLRDAEKACAVYDEEIEYDYRGPKGIKFNGKETVTNLITNFLNILPDNRVFINRILTMGNDATVELMSKEVDPRTGETVMMREILFFELRDGKIYKLLAYRMDPGLFTGDFAEPFTK